MRALWSIFTLIWQDQRPYVIRGAVLALLVLVMGAALLGLSGWFITAAATAGLIGAGHVFDVFRPSAMVRFLAIGRTAARYGERVMTHDATLRALTSLRVRLLSGMTRMAYDAVLRLRAGPVLNRIVADVDALDGVSLRLALPLGAGITAQLITMVALGVLVDWALALYIFASYMGLAVLVVVFRLRRLLEASRTEETAQQKFRGYFIDLIGARNDLLVYGQLAKQMDVLSEAETARQEAARLLDQAERSVGFILRFGSFAIIGGAIIWAGQLASAGAITPAQAAIAVFAALALVETIAPLRRALADMGRMVQAAQRTWRDVQDKPAPMCGPTIALKNPTMVFEHVQFSRGAGAGRILHDFNLTVQPGECVALAGPSGSGKSTVLMLGAGLIAPTGGQVCLGHVPVQDWPQDQLRDHVTMVAQRSSLLRGSIAQNLMVANPNATPAQMAQVIEAVALTDVFAARGGLEAQLGPRGAGLSGGEARRLVLARALLRQAQVLLLDEPTEGLDPETARRVLQGIRTFSPNASILVAAHRPAEQNWADRVVTIE
jgi:ATP-binding cassette subfamily C protein CydC